MEDVCKRELVQSAHKDGEIFGEIQIKLTKVPKIMFLLSLHWEKIFDYLPLGISQLTELGLHSF